LIIKCQGKKWKVHRAIVCSQSKPLAAAVDGSFKEAITGEIDLEEDDPKIVELMLNFLYRGDYQDGSGVTKPPTPPATSLFGSATSTPSSSSLYRAATPTLPNVSSSIFGGIPQATRTFPGFGESFPRSPPPLFTLGGASTQAVNTSSAPPFGETSSTTSSTTRTTSKPPRFGQSTPDSTLQPTEIKAKALITNANVYIIAEQYDIQPLKYLAKNKYEYIISAAWNTSFFVESLRTIYDGTPDSSKMDMLRELALNTAGKHAKELMDRGEFLTLCRERGDISTDILKASLNVEK
jgi:hypothetical protein